MEPSRAHFRQSKQNQGSTAALNFPLNPDLSKYGGFTPHPHKVVQKKGLAYVTDELGQDTQLRSQLDTRFKQALVPGWVIEDASESDLDKQAAAFVRENIENIEGTFYQDIYGLFSAVEVGFAVQEPVYETIKNGQWDGYLRLKKLKQIPAKHVKFDVDEAGEVLPDGIVFWPEGSVSSKTKHGTRYRYNRFVHVTHGPSESPYGEGVSIDCAFWVWIKKNSIKFWAFYAETFGMPAVKVTLPQGSGAKTDSASDEAKAQQIAEKIRSASGIVVPKGFMVEFLEAVRQGDVGFDNLLTRCDNEIAKRVNGNVLSTGTAGRGTGASYAIGKVHSGVGDTYSYADALWIQYVVNSQIIKRLVDLNFVVDKYPKFKLLDDSLSARIADAQTIQTLVASGARIPLRWLHEHFSIPLPQNGEEYLTPQSGLSSISQQGIDNKLFSQHSPSRNQSASAAPTTHHPQTFSVGDSSSLATSQVARAGILHRIERQAYVISFPNSNGSSPML